MGYAYKEKWKKTNNWRNKTAKSRKTHNARRSVSWFRSRPSDMNSSKLEFMFGSPRQTSSSLRKPFLQVLILLWGRGLLPGAWGAFFRGILMWPKAFLEPPGVSELQPCAHTHPKKKPCTTLVRSLGRTTNNAFLPAVEPDSHFYLL